MDGWYRRPGGYPAVTVMLVSPMPALVTVLLL
jgi:hypothetical protein